MKATSEKAQRFIRNYCNSSYERLGQVYSSWSDEKKDSFDEIMREMWELGGEDLRITGAGTYTYSCAYQLGKNLVYHTHVNRYVIENWKSVL